MVLDVMREAGDDFLVKRLHLIVAWESVGCFEQVLRLQYIEDVLEVPCGKLATVLGQHPPWWSIVHKPVGDEFLRY